MNRLTSSAASVSQALTTRFSCRAFLDKPVAASDINAILEMAVRAPSGGNLQPWNIWVMQGEPLHGLVADVMGKLPNNPTGEGAEYHIYPPDLQNPWDARRRDIGVRMYDVLQIPREDKAARAAQMAENFRFFGAPCALFFALHKTMQQGQWSDVGMLIQSISLLARERGLHSCPQEAWAIWAPTVKKHLNIGDDMMLFCGLALGYADPDALINQLQSPRAPMDEVVTYMGF